MVMEGMATDVALVEAPEVLAYREAWAALNDKQARFCTEYLIDVDPRRAAMRAGYTARSASNQGRVLLKDPRIIVVIQYLQARRIARTEVTTENVVRELAVLGFARMDDFMEEDDQGKLRLSLEKASKGQAGLAAVSSIRQDTYLEREGVDEDGKPIFEPIKKVEIKLWDKLGALDRLMRHLGAYNDALDLNLSGGPLGASVKMKDMTAADATDAYMDLMQGESPEVSNLKMANAKAVGPGGKSDGSREDGGR